MTGTGFTMGVMEKKMEDAIVYWVYMVVSLNYCSQNGGNLHRAPYYNGNPNMGPRIIGNLDQYPYRGNGKENGNYYSILGLFEEPAWMA